MSVVYKKLEEVCEILDSQRVPITAKDRKSGIHPYYGANGLQDHVSDYIFDDELVLLAEDGGNFGSKDRPIAYRVSGKCWVNNHAHVLKAKSNIHIDYLCYALMFYNTDGLVNGATRQKLTQAAIRQMVIPYRCMKEQEQIVDEISRVFHLIAVRNEELSLLEQLVKSRFIELFGDLASPDCKWETRKLVETCVAADDIKCGPFGTQLSKDEYVDSGVAVWEIPQINSLFATLPTHYLTEEKAKELDAYSIKAGDIAMSRKGNVGKCAVFPISFASGIIHSDVLRIRVDGSQVLPLFMMHQLHYSGSVQHQIELVSAGAIMAGINVTKLKQIFVHIPPMHLQQQFATFVEQTDKSKLAVQKALEELEILKKSLMQQYFG